MPEDDAPCIESLLHDLFSDESEEKGFDSAAVDAEAATHTSPRAGARRFARLPGLVHVPGFLSVEAQASLLAQIDAEGWFSGAECNQVMRFGTLPPWAGQLAGSVPSSLFPSEVGTRQPLFDQMIVNLYRPGEGITSHTDLLRFQDGICSISLAGPAVMRFRRDTAHLAAAAAATLLPGGPACGGGPLLEDPASLGVNAYGRDLPRSAAHDADTGSAAGVSVHTLQAGGGECEELAVLLLPGDLLLLSGEARFGWQHRIDAVHEETYEDEEVSGELAQRPSSPLASATVGLGPSSSGCASAGTPLPSSPARRAVRVVRCERRVSVTLRRLCDGIVLGQPETEGVSGGGLLFGKPC